MTDSESSRVLYLIVCAAPRTKKTGQLVEGLQADGWDVCVIATPAALPFLDVPAVEAQTGHPVRSRHKDPDAPDMLPPADAMVVCPATFNTINKWAGGYADNLAVSLITEAVGLGLPLIAAPSLNSAQEKHPAFRRSVEQLRAIGVRVLYGPGEYEPVPSGTGGRPYPWGLIVNALPRPGSGG